MKREAHKPETQFGNPVRLGNVPIPTDPNAALYQKQMANSGRYSEPRGGAPAPPIPRLDQPFVGEQPMTMADQARVLSPPAPPGAAVQQANQFFGPGGLVGVPSTFQPPTVAPKTPPIFRNDILPEVAKNDPAFRRGMGEMYATSQPEMAYKYGVLRQGKHITPQQLFSGGSSNLSQETMDGLAAVQRFQETRAKVESNEPAIEAASAAGPAGAAARFGQNAPDAEKPLTEGERAKVKDVVNNMDDFDFHTFREMLMKDILNNDEQRKLIESRLEPMDLSDLIVNNFVRQVVPVNSKLTFEFQSSGAEEDLALKRLIIQEAKTTGFHVDDKYILDKYAVMAMTIGVHAINKKPLLDYRDQNGNFSDENFWKKFNQVVKLNIHVMGSLSVNFFWFDIRVRRLVVAESLGNG